MEKKPGKQERVITYTFDDAQKNLKQLATELTLNYYRVSSIDLYADKEKEKRIKENGNWVFKDFKSLTQVKGSAQLYDHKNDQLEPYRRNVLVIGAGASYNGFENIPKGNKTIEEIKKKIIVCTIENKGFKPDEDITEKNQKFLKIDFAYLLFFAKAYEELRKDNPRKRSLEIGDFQKERHLHCTYRNQFLIHQFSNRAYSTLPEIAKKFLTSIKQWNLSHAIENSRLDNIEFETFFWSLCEIFPMEMVKNLLSETYSFRHAPTLFYSLVAHLFKNRFIDVIINFNFDELLDQAIQDEIGLTGYDRIISDGDCVPLDELTYGGRLRQPLYIKPHGTYSHKSSLRFTKDQYHNLPFDIRQTLIDLFSSQKEDQVKRANLICIGFDMNSVEFNEILAEHLPKDSKLFFFFNNGEESQIHEKVGEKAAHLEKQVLNRAINPITTYFVPNNFFNFAKTDNYVKELGLTSDSYLRSADFNSLDKSAYLLNHVITQVFKKDFKPRDVVKHKLICSIFGNKCFWKFISLRNKEKTEEPERWYPRDYFTSAAYFLDRVIVEMGINLAMNKGNFDPTRFLEGSAGYYYQKYLHKRGAKNVHTLLQLMKKFNWESSTSLKILGINSLERYNDDSTINFEKTFQDFIDKLIEGTVPISDYLQEFLKHDEQKIDGVKVLLSGLHKSNNSKIHSEFRATSNHIYEEFSAADILNTDLQLDLHAHIALTEDKANIICAVADNGYQLAKLLPYFIKNEKIHRKEKKSKKYKVFLIAEDPFYDNKVYDAGKFNALEKKIRSNVINWDIEFYKDGENQNKL